MALVCESGVLTPIYAVVANVTVTDSVYCPEQNRAALTTKFSASEAASAMEYMAMAGWKIEGIMNLAAASGEDLATTSIAAIAFHCSQFRLQNMLDIFGG